MARSGYNTNLASEFYVLSLLYRRGFDAYLTLGSKKSVDIAIVHGPGESVTVDVKAVAGKVDWPAGNIRTPVRENHFVVLLTYDSAFENLRAQPRIWIVPHAAAVELVESAKPPSTMRFIRRSRVRILDQYLDGWDLLEAGGAAGASSNELPQTGV